MSEIIQSITVLIVVVVIAVAIIVPTIASCHKEIVEIIMALKRKVK